MKTDGVFHQFLPPSPPCSHAAPRICPALRNLEQKPVKPPMLCMEPKHHLPDPKLNKLHFANTVTCLSNITWNAVETKEFPPLLAADRRPFSGQSTSNNTSRSCYRASWSKDSAAGTAILHGSASTCSVIKCHAFTHCCDTVHCS